jgi:hypothetical protein
MRERLQPPSKRKLAWVPTFVGMTLRGGKPLATHANVIPAQAGIHTTLPNRYASRILARLRNPLRRS